MSILTLYIQRGVMKQYNLGPNGAIMTALNLFATKFHQIMGLLEVCEMQECITDEQEWLSFILFPSELVFELVCMYLYPLLSLHPFVYFYHVSFYVGSSLEKFFVP